MLEVNYATDEPDLGQKPLRFVDRWPIIFRFVHNNIAL